MNATLLKNIAWCVLIYVLLWIGERLVDGIILNAASRQLENKGVTDSAMALLIDSRFLVGVVFAALFGCFVGWLLRAPRLAAIIAIFISGLMWFLLVAILTGNMVPIGRVPYGQLTVNLLVTALTAYLLARFSRDRAVRSA